MARVVASQHRLQNLIVNFAPLLTWHPLVLHVNFLLRTCIDLAIAASCFAALEFGQPLSSEPLDRIIPSLFEGYDRLIAKVTLSK
mmetsp:Transcript_24527/g.70476  ORF Transcript_24527/g.70476 Transcript_24527/m.70476 type:complete len:85 (+) Transcript_24527:19-273(+)